MNIDVYVVILGVSQQGGKFTMVSTDPCSTPLTGYYLGKDPISREKYLKPGLVWKVFLRGGSEEMVRLPEKMGASCNLF